MRKIYIKLKDIPYLILLGLLAVLIGTTAGTLFSDSKINIIKNIDVEIFKIPLNQTFPLIDCIYNSGDNNSSLSNQIKDLIGTIFNFDLNNPLTLLNSQSPLMSCYFLSNNKDKTLAKENQPGNLNSS